MFSHRRILATVIASTLSAVLFGACGPDEQVRSKRSEPSDSGPRLTLCDDPKLMPPRIWKLTDRQYANVVHDVFGDGIEIALETPSESPRAFLNVADAAIVDPVLAERYASSAEAIAAQVAPRLIQAIPTCQSSSIDSCKPAVTALAARLYRRPLLAEEASDLGAIFTLGAERDGTLGGFRLAVEAMLNSPSFLYRREVGTPDPTQTDRLALDDYELASALSFNFLDSLPDEELWAAATNGKLHDLVELAAQVGRLSSLPAARQQITESVMNWLHASAVLDVHKNERELPQFTGNLRKALYHETFRFAYHALWETEGSLATLLTAPYSFLDQELRLYYGLSPGDELGLQQVELPEDRLGILTQGSILAVLAGPVDSSVVRRGLYVRDTFLCRTIPPAPANLQSQVAAQAQSTGQVALADARAADPSCSGCHSLIDPVGLAFESFDGIGRRRPEPALDLADLKSELRGTLVTDGRFDSLTDLAHLLKNSEEVSLCVANQFNAHMFGLTTQTAAATCASEPHVRAFHESKDIVQLVIAFALSDQFRYRAEPK